MRPVKTYEFIVVLKKNSTKLIDTISLLMLAFSVAIFSYEFSLKFIEANKTLNANNGLMLVWIFGIMGWLYYCRTLQKRGMEPHYRFALLLAAWGWFMNPSFSWLSIFFLIAAVIEKPVKITPEYAFDEDGIVLNSIPQRKYTWTDMNNVVLNSGMLTLDFKSNKLVQKEVNDAVPDNVEKEFNAYCKIQLAK
ncbi:MAG: hypothetical protein KGZ59_04260 [Chitinophagaceae bacterium]|nr:hypothetical protein [Chitinophagaceae bacterium]